MYSANMAPIPPSWQMPIPHIGTDKLPRVIENMRNTIIECGGEVHFETRMDSLIIEKNKITGIETNTGKTFKRTCYSGYRTFRTGCVSVVV